MNKIEILSPAGDFEALRASVVYGADAVYLGSDIFGMRVSQSHSEKNFKGEKLAEAVNFAHKHKVKVYLTCNTTPTNSEIDLFPEFIKNAAQAGVDAAICSDFGVINLVKKNAPSLQIHISTQAGITNYAAAETFYELGASRVILARELSLEEISVIRAKTSPKLELETFVHGSMCVSYSGRCLLSAYMTERHANRGECSQPCRWKYGIIPQYSKTDSQEYELYETESGESFILNAKDLCAAPFLPEVIKAGVTSLKIEGRAKTAYYAGTVTNVYRSALDSAVKNEFRNFDTDFIDFITKELDTVSHREYCSGFYFGRNKYPSQETEKGGYSATHKYAALVISNADAGDRTLNIRQKNYFTNSDKLELILPKGNIIFIDNFKIKDSFGELRTKANKASEILTLELDEQLMTPIPENALIRTEIKSV